MAVVMRTDIKYKHDFDRKTKRHRLNDNQIVLHCHHYLSLYTQLALDANETELLKECARENFRLVLDSYFKNNPDIDSLQAKLEIGCQYYGLFGLGKLTVDYLGDDAGEVTLSVSHTDSGWIKKWGPYDKPVNYITAGYVEALFESVLCLPDKSFEAVETQSIVMGADVSRFKAIRR